MRFSFIYILMNTFHEFIQKKKKSAYQFIKHNESIMFIMNIMLLLPELTTNKDLIKLESIKRPSGEGGATKKVG